MSTHLSEVLSQRWFYEFRLPDGSTTSSYLPEHVRAIHATRQGALRVLLARAGLGDANGPNDASALDVACHEGFFTFTLAEFFATVRGIDKNAESVRKASLMAQALAVPGVRIEQLSVEELTDGDQSDFVLCFGLVYHVENPILVFRQLGRLAREAVCIETQVLPCEIEAHIEDGNYLTQRPVQGLFAMCEDYSTSAEGGLTDIALVPSRKALEACLKAVGFSRLTYYQPTAADYEQFVRGHRVVLLAQR